MPPAVPRIPRICAVCAAPFGVREKELAEKPRAGLYCSAKCRIVATRKQLQVTCAHCGLGFGRIAAAIGPSGRVWCDTDCQSAYWAANRKSYRRIRERHAHRVVAEQWLDRPLRPGEIVHHIDENRSNAHPTNLCVFPDARTHLRCHWGRLSQAEFDSYRLVNLLPPVRSLLSEAAA